jgi:hypothetical protein
MTTYKLIRSVTTGEISIILKDGKDSIPFAPDNTDYQAYLKWVEQGNTPLPAEE